MPRAPQGTRKGKGGGFWPFPGRFPNVQNADAWNAFHERSERVLFAVRASLDELVVLLPLAASQAASSAW